MNKKVRGFEYVNGAVECGLPKRGTKGSAGYDFFSPEEITIEAGCKAILMSGIKSYMMLDEVLKLYPRSSYGKKGLVFLNTTGIIDSTYYNNKDNEGNIGFMLKNTSDSPIKISKGERFAQGVFVKFLVADGDSDDILEERIGGFGSTGR